MKIFDCTTYFEEDLMMDLRFNILNNYVDKFIVSEATFLIVEMIKKLDLILIILKNLKKRLFMLLLKKTQSIVMKKPLTLVFKD